MCGIDRMEANNDQLVQGQGEFYDHYVRKMFMAAHSRVLQLEKAG